MSFGKILGITAILLLLVLVVAVAFKDNQEPREVLIGKNQSPPTLATKTVTETVMGKPIEIELDDDVQQAAPAQAIKNVLPKAQAPALPVTSQDLTPQEVKSTDSARLPDADRIQELFNIKDPKLPIVETITYKSRVAWQKGRPAWLSDYASHYETSRHFIARSLNGKPDYMKQEIAEGDKFNVLRQDKAIEFQLVIDTSRCRMWFYALDGSTKEKILLKTYPVSLGRTDSGKVSGLLTPLGKYSLGSRVAVYKPTVMGHHKGQKVEMIQVFGTRWIPFEKEIANTTAPAKGFGIHGVPWTKKKNGDLEQDLSSLGKYESDGCIRMSSNDVEELFAIIITKPTYVELVKDFSQSELVAK